MTLEEQFTRLIQILQLIDSEPWQWDAADLEAKFSVSRATIERDIAILRQWGQIKRKNGKFGLAEMKFLPTSFTPPEALALRIAGSTFAEQAGAGYRDALATALKKIDQVLPQRISAEIRRAHARVAVSQPVVREFSASVYQDLQNAMIHHNPVDITYFSRSRSEPSKRRVDPYGLTFKIGAWYMVGFCHLRQGIRTFGLDRIKWLRVEDKLHFRYPADFDLQEWLAKGWQLQAGGEPTEVVVRFAPAPPPGSSAASGTPPSTSTNSPTAPSCSASPSPVTKKSSTGSFPSAAQAEVLEPAPLRVAVADARAEDGGDLRCTCGETDNELMIRCTKDANLAIETLAPFMGLPHRPVIYGRYS